VPDHVSYADLAAAIGRAAGPLLYSFQLFDVYRGAPVPEGHRSLAVSLAFRSPDRTLSEEEIVSAMEAIEREVAAQFGARVRGR
jgi:phenylalanyl-tRNA synthetase beta chain